MPCCQCGLPAEIETVDCLTEVAAVFSFPAQRMLPMASDEPFPPRTHVSVEEFARLSGLSPKTIRRRLDDGSLPKFQPGGPRTRVTIPLAALQAVAPECGAERPQELRQNSQSPSIPAGPRPQWTRHKHQNNSH